MRSVLLPVCALAFASPALAASPPSDAQRETQVMADTLNRPETQAALAGSLDAMLGAILDMRVDGIAKAMEPLNKGRKMKLHGRTVREMAAHDDPHFEARMHDQSHAAISSMGALASAFAAIVPQIEAAARKMEDALPDTK